MFISCVKNRAEDASGDAKQGIVFLSPEAHAFWVAEWIPRFTERLFDVLDSLERADSNPGGARLQRLEWMITAISELLQKQGQQTPVHASAWYRLFIEGAVDDRLARERPLENATKEWAIIVRALCASASDSVHCRMLMDRLLGLASAENVLPSLKAWRLRLLGQACRRYPDASELARCYGSTIGHLAMSACSAHGERALYKAGGKLFRGLMQGLSDTWSQSVHICPLSEDEQWRRVKTLWDQGYALHQSCQRVCWQQIHVMWRQPTLDTIEKAWSLFEENLAAIQRIVGDQWTTVDPDRAKAVARWLFSLRRAARWLLSGKKRVDTDSLVSSDNVSESSDADDWFDALDDIDTTTAPGTDSKGDSGPANTWNMRLTNWTPLQGNASGFIDWLPSNASQLLEQWQALVLQVAVAADPDTLQREALRPFEIAHQGFEYDGPRAQRSGRGRFRRQFALQVLDEHMIDASPWTLLRGPDLVIESLALAALEHRRSFAARAGAFAIASRDPELAVISFPNSLLKLLLSERGVLSDYPGIAQRARSLLLPACRYLSPRAMESQVLNPIWRELDYSANTYDEVALFQHRVRLESIFILLDALLPRLCSEAALFRTTIAVVLRSGCRGSWMTSVPQVHGLAMTLLMKACLRVRRLSVLGAPRSCGEDARCMEPNLDHQLREPDFATMLANVAKMGVYVEPEQHLADTAAAPRLAWLARAVAALLLVYDDLVDCAHWRNLGIQDQSSQVAQSWRRALEAAFSLANDKYRAALRQIGVLLISRLCACGIVTEDASKSSWISCIDVQELVRSMYCDAKGPLHLFISSSTSPIDAATAVSKGADLWSAIVSSVAELVPGTGVAAHLATASSVFVVTDAVSSWELVSGGPAWPRLWDGRLGTSAMISRRAGEHWTFPMLARVRCLEHLHHLMNEQERQRVSWYMDGDSDLSAASTASVELDEIERLRRLEHEILIATAIRDMNRLGRCIMKCTSQSVWRSLAVPALRYLADHARSAQAVITEEMLYHDLVLEPMSSRGLWESDPWGALLDEGAQADSNAVLRALNCLEALGRFAPPDGLRYEYLMGRASSAERDAAASTLAVWVANHSSLLAHVLEIWRAFITGLEQAASSGIANTETIVAERLFAARDTLVGFLQRACYWRQHDITESLQSLEPSLIDWCLRQLNAVIVLDGGDTNGVSSRRGNTGAGASLGQREALAQRARSTWYLLAQSRSPTLLHRALAHAAELLANSRNWSVRSTAINAIHLALNDYPFLIQRQRSLVQDTHFAGSAFRWFDDLMPFLSDTEIAVRKAAAQALASWCRWFVPNAADGDDEDALYERIIKNRWCNPNPSVDEFARALVLSCLIQSHPYDVRPRWMSDALGAMVMLAETPSGSTKQAVAVSRRREAAQAARRCLQSFCHMHRAQWTREQEQLDPSIRELLSDLWLGSPYVV
ncbi:hypothetical protein F1559_001115 [Cyanidiococcus yangmingshanensis]|uniref:Proteasome activator complex subunit 4 C-terminal domain-containing protein n=1 Tax=Cyanidiococcus yangmingshanensis TaxID=2690220 RepID=A0A7J7IDC1_9RHOD|nr:hypothetical protein F1559_001115 [Cyanidiococcus yangmingshanensis]